MKTLTEQDTVGEIVAAQPATVRVFENHNIDYCCGGKFSLADACQGRGISPAQLLAELDTVTAPEVTSATQWNLAELSELIDYIVSKHHNYLKAELPRLQTMLAKVIQAHGEHHSDSLLPLQETFEGLKSELHAHLQKEELILFPLIRQIEAAYKEGAKAGPAHCGTVNNPIRVMEHEHDNAGRALEAMRKTSNDYTVPSDACNTYRALFQGLQELEADLHQHIHLENNILFPRASKMETVV